MRSSSLLTNKISHISKIDALIFVSSYWQKYFNDTWGAVKRSYVIANGVDISKFKIKSWRSETKKIALICQLRGVKNIGLAFQIVNALPGYTLHHIGFAGENMDYLPSYVKSIGLDDRVFFEGQTDDVAGWLADKEYILSTSFNEGNPNNVFRGHVDGDKTRYPLLAGAAEQFPTWLIFNTINGAVRIIDDTIYTPLEYRKFVKENHSLKNFERIHEVIEHVSKGQ